MTQHYCRAKGQSRGHRSSRTTSASPQGDPRAISEHSQHPPPASAPITRLLSDQGGGGSMFRER